MTGLIAPEVTSPECRRLDFGGTDNGEAIDRLVEALDGQNGQPVAYHAPLHSGHELLRQYVAVGFLGGQLPFLSRGLPSLDDGHRDLDISVMAKTVYSYAGGRKFTYWGAGWGRIWVDTKSDPFTVNNPDLSRRGIEVGRENVAEYFGMLPKTQGRFLSQALLM